MCKFWGGRTPPQNELRPFEASVVREGACRRHESARLSNWRGRTVVLSCVDAASLSLCDECACVLSLPLSHRQGLCAWSSGHAIAQRHVIALSLSLFRMRAKDTKLSSQRRGPGVCVCVCVCARLRRASRRRRARDRFGASFVAPRRSALPSRRSRHRRRARRGRAWSRRLRAYAARPRLSWDFPPRNHVHFLEEDLRTRGFGERERERRSERKAWRYQVVS